MFISAYNIRNNWHVTIIIVPKKKNWISEQIGLHRGLSNIDKREITWGYFCKCCTKTWKHVVQVSWSPIIRVVVGLTKSEWFSIHIFDSIILQFYFNRYKKYFEEGKLEKSLDVVRDYLNRLDELKVDYPHRNYEIATIALCGCTWGMTQSC